MANVTNYRTIYGDRWDTVAYKAYGDATRIRELVEANPDLPIQGKLPAGVIINVPILDSPSAAISDTLLPPWKR